MRELNRATEIDENDRPSKPRYRHRPMSPTQRKTSDSRSDSDDQEDRAGLLRLRPESIKDRWARSRRRNNLEDSKVKRRRNKRESFHLSDVRHRHKSNSFSTDTNSSSGEHHIHRRTKTRDGEDTFKVTCPVMYLLEEAVDYRAYRRANSSSKIDREVSRNVTKRPKRMMVQMNSLSFHLFDPISIRGFLKIFELVCATTGTYEGAAMRRLYVSMNRPASAVLNAWLSADSGNKNSFRKTTVKSKYLTTYPQVVIFLLEKYATDETITETESVITRFAQTVETIPAQFNKELVTKLSVAGICRRSFLWLKFSKKDPIRLYDSFCANIRARRRKRNFAISRYTRHRCWACRKAIIRRRGYNQLQSDMLRRNATIHMGSHYGQVQVWGA